MFNAIRKGLMGAARASSRAGLGVMGNSAARGYGGTALSKIGSGLGAMSRMSNAGLSGAMGAVGGIYGGFSEDGSVLGGALKGAALGAGAYGASRLGRMGYSAYRNSAGGVGQKAMQSLYAMGGMSRAYIGNTLRSNGAINAMGRGARQGAGRILGNTNFQVSTAGLGF